MAKARRISGLSAGDPYAAAAARIVGVRAAELIEHARGVLDVEDIERVHDMRVATRRLRAALEIFGPCFPGAEVKAALRQVKALADALGERRDRDVAIAAFEEIIASMGRLDRPGVAILIARLRLEQAAANDALARCATEDQLASLSEQLAGLVAHAESMPGEGGGPITPVEAVWLPQRVSGADTAQRPHAVGGGM